MKRQEERGTCCISGVDVTESDFLKILLGGPGDLGAGGTESALGKEGADFSMLGTPVDPSFFRLSEDCSTSTQPPHTLLSLGRLPAMHTPEISVQIDACRRFD